MKNSKDLGSLQYFDALFKRLKQNNVLLMDAQGFVLQINTAFTVSFGYAAEDIIGRNFSLLFTKENQALDLPRRELATVLAQGQCSDNNYLVTKDQQLVWVSGESVLVESEQGDPFVLKVIYNIQVQKDSEVSLLRLNEINKNVLSNIDDAVAVVNTEYEIEEANQSFRRLFSLHERKQEKHQLQELVQNSKENEGLLDSLRETTLTRKGFRDKRLMMKDHLGDEKVFEVNCTVLSVTGSDAQFLLVLHDITSHIQIEREREDIIGFVAHELRNPLANIMLCNEMIYRLAIEKSSDEIVDFITRSKNNTTRLNRMVTELYDATKMNSGHFRLDLTELNLAELIREAVFTTKILQPLYNITVTEEGAPAIVKADRYRLLQVIDNFLSNSIKYSNGNSNIYISLWSDDSSAFVCVKDEGLGIPASQLPHIFDRFFRAEKTMNLEGVGLGLYLCREIILAHKGKIWAESKEGEGSNFCFSLPLYIN